MSKQKPFFYGWVLVGFAWIVYGFGITPAYISWGFFAPEMIADLGFNRGDIGGVFGVFTFLYSGVGPLVGLAQARWGIRPVMTVGALCAAAGLLYMSRADSLLDCYIGFALLGGSGIGFSTIIPCQTLGQNWFLKRRALAIAIIFSAGGIVGRLWPPINRLVLEHADWRTGWMVIAGVSVICAILAALFIRDTPEQVGQLRDGATPDTSGASNDLNASADDLDRWTASQALRTSQFAMLALCGCAYAIPWGVIASHGRLHLQDLGFEITTAGAILGTMFLVSVLGRFSAALGDIIAPQKVLSAALFIEGCGVALLLFASTKTLAYVAVILVGLGFGAAYISIPVVFAAFFGRKAFATTSGVRIFITGVFNGLSPLLTGLIYDQVESYAIPFLAIAALTIIGSLAAATLKSPPLPESVA